MIHSLLARYHQGTHTIGYPQDPPPEMPVRYQGRPIIDQKRCRGAECTICLDCCPDGALKREPTGLLSLDTGLCLFCGVCVHQCPRKALSFSRDFVSLPAGVVN